MWKDWSTPHSTEARKHVTWWRLQTRLTVSSYFNIMGRQFESQPLVFLPVCATNLSERTWLGRTRQNACSAIGIAHQPVGQPSFFRKWRWPALQKQKLHGLSLSKRTKKPLEYHWNWHQKVICGWYLHLRLIVQTNHFGQHGHASSSLGRNHYVAHHLDPFLGFCTMRIHKPFVKAHFAQRIPWFQCGSIDRRGVLPKTDHWKDSTCQANTPLVSWKTSGTAPGLKARRKTRALFASTNTN